MARFVVTRQGPTVTVTMTCDQVETIYSGLKDLAHWIGKDDPNQYDPGTREQLAQTNLDMANELERAYLDTIPSGTDMKDLITGKV